jgi:hypothetical protein
MQQSTSVSRKITHQYQQKCQIVPLDKYLRSDWDSAPEEGKKFFLKLLFWVFEDARKWDDGQEIKLAQLDSLAREKFVNIPVNMQFFIILAYDRNSREFSHSNIRAWMERHQSVTLS